MIKVTEAETIINIANFLIKEEIVQGKIQISLDGMHKKVYPNWEKLIKDFEIEDKISEQSNSGYGDIVAEFTDDNKEKFKKNKIFIECKKGSFDNSKNSSEYKLMKEAIGQIATVEKFEKDTLYAIAVPKSVKTVDLANKWVETDGIKNLGLKILLLDNSGKLIGLSVDEIEKLN